MRLPPWLIWNELGVSKMEMSETVSCCDLDEESTGFKLLVNYPLSSKRSRTQKFDQQAQWSQGHSLHNPSASLRQTAARLPRVRDVDRHVETRR